MILSDRDLKARLERGDLVVRPLEKPDVQIQPASIDLRLASDFITYRLPHVPVLDPNDNDLLATITETHHVAGGDAFILHPGEFALGATFEQVSLPDDIAARLEGKSSLGRLGLITHSTAGFVDPGFTGHVTLELANVATLPIKLWPGMKIGQFCFFRLTSPAEHAYGSGAYGNRYQGQRGPTASRSYLNFHRIDVSTTDAGAIGG